jgi:phosphoribosylformimino-5-aminoimidazole carboxamide ribotide isomerase
MQVVPAVDIRGGRCVRLLRGDYDRETVFGDDPVAQARAWHEQGASLVHVVDLDGARDGVPAVLPLVRRMVAAGVPVELGGGIRTDEAVDAAIEAGAGRVILGTAALADPGFLAGACARHPGRIVAGIDARDGRVAVRGWTDTTEADAEAFAVTVRDAGAARIIYTDIQRDGAMTGPNFDATRRMAEVSGLPVTLSGGISRLDDLARAGELEAAGVDEVIVGRALYEGAFTLAEALAAARNPA